MEEETRYICFMCGTLIRGIPTTRDHECDGLGYTLYLCPTCSTASMCPASMNGAHGLIYTADEPEFSLPLWPVEEVRLLAGAEHAFGQCSNCRAPMRWDTSRQRWADLNDDEEALVDALHFSLLTIHDHLRGTYEPPDWRPALPAPSGGDNGHLALP